ncbi:hypothetical protein U14_02776 [Candidatus Moduliflexus flocculans]|uniref:Uncharacterized protein n=1 Tax=Candidatus Moduliflexus flocculans TaxID=1499966 RepID=A0A081BMB5_9BACT|nr:hypothetical protein U14_02776 [Candidatus Moduliflexus flocculans]
MSENVIIAIIGAIGTLTGGIVGTIGSILIAKINRPPQEQKTLLPPSSGFSKIKFALITAVVGLGAGLLISFWVFSGKLPHSQDNTAVTPVTNVSDPVPAQKTVTSAKPLLKATSDSAPTQKAEPTQEVQAAPTQEAEPTQKAMPTQEVQATTTQETRASPTQEVQVEPTQKVVPTQEAAPKEEKEKPKPAPKEEKEKPKPAPKEEKEKPKPAPKEEGGKKKK